MSRFFIYGLPYVVVLLVGGGCGNTSRFCSRQPVELSAVFLRNFADGNIDQMRQQVTPSSLALLEQWEKQYKRMSVQEKNRLRKWRFVFSKQTDTSHKNGTPIQTPIQLLAYDSDGQARPISLKLEKKENCLFVDLPHSSIPQLR